ncbi:hypothetical protein, partial [Stenotrophomonas sp.]|uniref:hypothetical protein n=1 Tax=Stenotrophomonas sp. TaxID=69392 RepID=UPI0028AB48B9
ERGFDAAIAGGAAICQNLSPSPLAGEGLGRGGSRNTPKTPKHLFLLQIKKEIPQPVIAVHQA